MLGTLFRTGGQAKRSLLVGGGENRGLSIITDHSKRTVEHVQLTDDTDRHDYTYGNPRSNPCRFLRCCRLIPSSAKLG